MQRVARRDKNLPVIEVQNAYNKMTCLERLAIAYGTHVRSGSSAMRTLKSYSYVSGVSLLHACTVGYNGMRDCVYVSMGWLHTSTIP